MERTGSTRLRLAVVLVALVLLLGAGIIVIAGNAGRGSEGQLKIIRAWSDGVDSAAGSTYYLIDVNVTDSGPSVWHLDPSLFSLASNGSRSYGSTSNYSELALLGKQDVLPGHEVSGRIAFLLPSDQAPSTLSYGGGSTISVQPVAVPPISGEASRFDPSVHFLLKGTSAQEEDITADGLTAWAGITMT